MPRCAPKWNRCCWPAKMFAPAFCNRHRWPADSRSRSSSAGVLAAGQIFAQRFQLVRKLGEGGMGQVWLAEQTSPVRRQVALKLIKAGMYDESVVQRFQVGAAIAGDHGSSRHCQGV